MPVKRACNAFTYFVKDRARTMSEFSSVRLFQCLLFLFGSVSLTTAKRLKVAAYTIDVKTFKEKFKNFEQRKNVAKIKMFVNVE